MKRIKRMMRTSRSILAAWTRLAPPLAIVLTLSLLPASAMAQTALERAASAYTGAQQAEVALKEQPRADRSRADYLRVIREYERVYLITPHTGYADNALVNIAALYEEIDDERDAMRTLDFLIREYPASRFIAAARTDLERLRGVPEPEARAIAEGSDRPSGVVTVNNIRYWESQKSVRVVVDLSGPVEFAPGDAQNPPRFFVDLHNARLGTSLEQREFPVESVMLQNVRVGQHDTETVRVVLDLVQYYDATIFTLRDPERLVIDVLGNAPEPARPEITEATPDPVLTLAPEPAVAPDTTGDQVELAAIDVDESVASEIGIEPATLLALAETTVAPDSVVAPANSAGTDSTDIPIELAVVEPATIPDPEPAVIGVPARPTANGAHSLIRSLGLKVGRVVIDPGHGGRDTGTIGPSGLTEKDLVLDLAHRLRERIENEIGAEVVLTRGDDTFVPLETRTAMANQAEADLFLSIHANSSDVRTIRGFETYILNLATSNEALEIAARENASSQASISELQDLVSKIALQETVDESRELATHIQAAMAARQEFGRNRGVKQAPFVVLIGANMPSILAEVSFISNPDDEQLLKGEDGRRAIVEALFDGVRSYLDTLSAFRTARVE